MEPLPTSVPGSKRRADLLCPLPTFACALVTRDAPAPRTSLVTIIAATFSGFFCYTRFMKEIVQDGNPALREAAKEVPADLFNTPELKKILQEMEESLDAAKHGVALAAPQVAIPYRIFIVRYDRMVQENTEEEKTPDIGIFINPEIVKTSRKKTSIPEGCLSVDGVYGTTERFERATVKAQDIEGNWFTRGGGGILAQAYQHEIDHLNGILFIDHAEDLEQHES